MCQEKGIRCYRLPIEMYMEHSTDGGTFNQILAINQGKTIISSFLRLKSIICF